MLLNMLKSKVAGSMSEPKRLEEIENWFTNVIKEALKPRCPFCGAKLSHYWFYMESYDLRKEFKQFQICPKCKKEVVRK